VRVPPSGNPSSGPAVKITRVNDIRPFELRPAVASIPSLKDGQINNKSITSRALARKRNSYGKALGDILLPEGSSVEDLVHSSAKKALQEQGYVVVEKGDPQYTTALPVELDIHQFWAWVNMGFWALELNFEGVIEPKNRDVFTNSREKIRGHVSLKTQAATERAWAKILSLGLENLGQEFRQNIKNPTDITLQSIGKKSKPLVPQTLENTSATATESDISEKLRTIQQLRADNVITEDEYQQKRKAIIDSF